MVKVKTSAGLSGWLLRLALWVHVLVNIPLYLGFLHHMGGRWGQHLPPGDDLRFWLPIVVPLAAFSFTTISCLSWWWTTETRYFLLGRKKWWFLMLFVVALSMMAGVFGSTSHDFIAVLLTVMVTTLGITALWLLPAALNPHLLDTLRPSRTPPTPS